MQKIRAFLIGPLPFDDAIAKQALEIAFGEIETVSAPSLSEATGSADIIVAAFPIAKTTEQFLAAAQQTSGPVVVGLGDGDLEHGAVIGETAWTLSNLARAFRTAMQTHKLRSENQQLKNDLLTVARRISHDLRTPLSCIHTNGDMIKELGLAALDEATLRESAGFILDSVKEATSLVNRISLVLRASAEMPKLEPIDSGMTFQEALRILNPPNQISTPDAWPGVMAVPAWLTTIWTNLIENAVRHGGQNAEIRIGWQENFGRILFSVTDNGPGVSNRKTATLFRPFEQLHTVEGGGLGLSIVHRLVTRLGGTCGYLRPSTGGACFTFSLKAGLISSAVCVSQNKTPRWEKASGKCRRLRQGTLR